MQRDFRPFVVGMVLVATVAAPILARAEHPGAWVNRRLTFRHPAAKKEDTFASRLFTEPRREGRWLTRRLTIRHHDQDAPRATTR